MIIEDIIKDKIEHKSRKNIVYIHPVISNEEIVKYISAFANGDGGIILFGVKDDGLNLLIKKSAFNILKKEKEIMEMIDSSVKCEFGKILNKEYKLEYISVEKSENWICFNGIAYNIDTKNNKPKQIQNKTIFLSYCGMDCDIADIVEEKLTSMIKQVKISRDVHDVGYKESFTKFMQSVGNHDYVISIISDSYLKSRNCMYEVLELMRDRRFMDRLLYIVIFEKDIKLYKDDAGNNEVANIYSTDGQTQYMLWWKNEGERVRREIKELGDPLLVSNLTEELKLITRIQIEIQEFMKVLYDSKAVPLIEMLESDFKDIISNIKID